MRIPKIGNPSVDYDKVDREVARVGRIILAMLIIVPAIMLAVIAAAHYIGLYTK